MNCRTIVKEVQAVTREIGETLDLLVLACAAVSIDIRKHAEQISQHMRAVEFQASETELRVSTDAFLLLFRLFCIYDALVLPLY